eukprot:6720977-Alexandrium_andersonii.AAC.1
MGAIAKLRVQSRAVAIASATVAALFAEWSGDACDYRCLRLRSSCGRLDFLWECSAVHPRPAARI